MPTYDAARARARRTSWRASTRRPSPIQGSCYRRHVAPPSASDREAAFWQGVTHSGRFFMGDSDVHRALRKLVATLAEHAIPYAIVGAMALNEYG